MTTLTPLSLASTPTLNGKSARRDLTQRLAPFFRFGILALVYTFAASASLQRFMTSYGFRGDQQGWGLERMIDGTAHRPFAYRVLSPTLIRAASSVVADRIPGRVRQFLVEESPVLRLRNASEYTGWDYSRALHLHIAYVYVFLCFVGIGVAARYLLLSAGFRRSAFVDFAPGVAVLMLPITFVNGAYVYDAPELLLLTLATALLLQQRWRWYYPVLVLAILNKESDALLAFSFLAITWKTLESRAFWRHSAAHVLVCGGVLFAVRYALHDRPGSTVWTMLQTNLQFWSDPRSYFLVFSGPTPLIPVPRGANVVNLFLALFAVAAWWREKPSWLRRLIPVMFAINLPLLLLFCMHDELRNLSLTFPGMFIALCLTLQRVYGGTEAAPQALPVADPGVSLRVPERRMVQHW